MKNWLSIKEAANEMGVSVSTIRRWIDNGLKAKKIRRIIRIHSADLDAYLNNSCFSSKLPSDRAVDSYLNPR
jgi:excisionase family DNA binding protein